MIIKELKINEGSFPDSISNSGLEISIDGVSQGSIYKFNEMIEKGDYMVPVCFLDIILDWLEFKLNISEKVEIENLIIDYLGIKKILSLRDSNLIINRNEEDAFIEKIKLKIFIKNICILNFNGCQDIIFFYIKYFSNSLTINSIVGLKELWIRPPNITKLDFIILSEIDSIKIEDVSDNSELEINANLINKLEIYNQIGSDQSIKRLIISGVTVLDFTIYGLNTILDIFHFEFNNSIVKKGFFEKLNIQSLDWARLDMENVIFSDIIFPQVSNKFFLRYFFIHNCIFGKVNWGNYFSDGKSYSSVQKGETKEIYRMFKYEYDQIGNKTEANKFFAKEMEYYRKSLLDSYSWRTFFDLGIGQKRVVCWYNQLTNDFGNSWIRPIFIMILLVGVATFYEFLNSTGNFNLNTQILSNILPISEIGKFTTWFDFLYQITWAALIYQFIIALRRISQR